VTDLAAANAQTLEPLMITVTQFDTRSQSFKRISQVALCQMADGVHMGPSKARLSLHLARYNSP